MIKKVQEKPSPLKYRRGDPLQLDVRDEAIHRHAPRETEEVEFLETVAGQQHCDRSVLFPLGRLKKELNDRIESHEDVRKGCLASARISTNLASARLGYDAVTKVHELKEVLAIIQRLETEGNNDPCHNQ